MKCSDYIVQFLIHQGVTDVFGYPGGMVTHLMESFRRYSSEISAHVMYHEQGAAFAACGYAQTSGRLGVAYATSGPGATNLITGICNAYFDSIPVLFLTGQVNTFESKDGLSVRQRGFQETDIVSMVSSVTKFCVKVKNAEQIRSCLEQAAFYAMEGRKGPVLLDIPMDITRTEVEPEQLMPFAAPPEKETLDGTDTVLNALMDAERPVLLIGNGLREASGRAAPVRNALKQLKIPVVSTMLAVDLLGRDPLYYGFIGAYGSRTANFIVEKADLVISLGARLDVRQVGGKRSNFAPHAKLIRVDLDPGEMEYSVNDREIDLCADAKLLLQDLELAAARQNIKDWSTWISVCDKLQDTLKDFDLQYPNQIIRDMSRYLPENAVITTDVGQNQVWAAQSLDIQPEQRVLFSGGHGAMGYSLPAAIGCWYGAKCPVISLNGDGGLQMNLQELQVIRRESLPIKIVVFNNQSLGMIRHFQEMYFEKQYFQTTSGNGYSAPNFQALAQAYGLKYMKIKAPEDLSREMFAGEDAALIEVCLPQTTYVFPKLEYGKPNNDQEPLLDRTLFDRLMAL